MYILHNPVRFSSLVEVCVHTRYKPKKERVVIDFTRDGSLS